MSRLRLEIARCGEKQAAVARRAGIAPETLNRIINGHGRPGFDTVVRIARAAGVRVGWLLDEPGYTFSAEQRKHLREEPRSSSKLRRERNGLFRIVLRCSAGVTESAETLALGSGLVWGGSCNRRTISTHVAV